MTTGNEAGGGKVRGETAMQLSWRGKKFIPSRAKLLKQQQTKHDAIEYKKNPVTRSLMVEREMQQVFWAPRGAFITQLLSAVRLFFF